MSNSRVPRGDTARETQPRSRRPGSGTWLVAKGPVVMFVLKFTAFSAALYAMSLLPAWDGILSHWLQWNARIAGSLVNLMGGQCHVSGDSIWSASYAVTVSPECSALEYAGFLSAALLSFPSPFRCKIAGILAGVAILVILNLVRIASLYWIGVRFAASFAAVHVTVWPGALVVVTLLICVCWLRWVTRKNETDPV